LYISQISHEIHSDRASMTADPYLVLEGYSLT
jgi:hypothetical protein